MWTSPILLPSLLLATAASAVNIRMFPGSSACTGGSTLCLNLALGQCCSSSLAVLYRSIQMENIPADRTLELSAFQSGGCRSAGVSVRGPQCLRGGTGISGFGSALYRVVVADGGRETRDVGSASGGNGEDCKQPEILELEDGTAFNITGLLDQQTLELQTSHLGLQTPVTPNFGPSNECFYAAF
ncbi:hypothetical protein Micbo1qcDRAFT_209025 [Microdochium bolleyi]|uniref:Uncharacterized protein n=1 Tax=Microdochium bolleyi TaxID=196109 RepID=A0A136INY2_9PEZI|nr:hypothetical protein Micbo1qcDRAFT_209025 [Microdochium bolleyi]